MWFIKSWILRNRYGSLPFKIRNFTESLQEDCREEIKTRFQEITKRLPHIWTRIKLKEAKENMHSNYVDILGRSHPVKQPIFTENEVARFRQHLGTYRFVFALMIFFESILYSLMANLFIPKNIRKEYPGIEILFGLAFAVIFVFALHFAFKSIWNYFEAKYLVEKNGLPVIELKPFKKYMVLAILILLVFIVTNIYTGFIRAVIFEGSGTTSTSLLMQTLHGPLLVFSIAITFIVALVMALLEKEIAEKSEKYKVYNNWKKQQIERKEYNTAVRLMLKSCQEVKDICLEKYWGVIKDVQRVFEQEVDEDKQALYNELNEKIAAGEIDLLNLDDSNYQKYLTVSATRHELFEFGVLSDPEITSVLSDLRKKVNEIEDFEKRNALKSDE